MTKLAEIEGIGEVYSAKLEAGGIFSVQKLLEAGKEKKVAKRSQANVTLVKN